MAREQNALSVDRKSYAPVGNIVIFVLSLDVAVILYYACVAEPITTVAHVSAVLLGFLISIGTDNLTKGIDSVTKTSSKGTQVNDDQSSLLGER